MTRDELVCTGVCDLKDGNDSRGLKAKTYVMTGKVEFALREAEPETVTKYTHVV